MSDPTPPITPAPIWQRHRGLIIALTVVVVLLITVLSDLPTSTSRASDINAERSVMKEINNDLASCALAIHQAVGIWNLQSSRKLTPAGRAPTPGLLSDDQSACSFTNQDIFDLVNIDVPGTPAGKHVGQLVSIATLWTTSDALRAIEDVQTLMNDPNDTSVLRNLSNMEARMAADRRSAIAQEEAADGALDTHLQPIDLPEIVGTSTG